jgi:hypothetical protein
LLKWATAQGKNRVIGVEGGGSYGAGLPRHLLDAGEDVYEVPAFLSYRERKRNPSRGKSDTRRRGRHRPRRGERRGAVLAATQRRLVFVELNLLSDHRDRSFAPAPS